MFLSRAEPTLCPHKKVNGPAPKKPRAALVLMGKMSDFFRPVSMPPVPTEEKPLSDKEVVDRHLAETVGVKVKWGYGNTIVGNCFHDSIVALSEELGHSGGSKQRLTASGIRTSTAEYLRKALVDEERFQEVAVAYWGTSARNQPMTEETRQDVLETISHCLSRLDSKPDAPNRQGWASDRVVTAVGLVFQISIICHYHPEKNLSTRDMTYHIRRTRTSPVPQYDLFFEGNFEYGHYRPCIRLQNYKEYQTLPRRSATIILPPENSCIIIHD